MKTWLIALSMAVAGATLVTLPTEADARRLGGGKSAGMQRQAPPAKPADAPTAQPNNAAAAAPAAAAAQAGKRSWMGPIAGLAAGLGIAALLSHFGLGAGFANFLTMLLIAAAAFFVVRWLLRRFAGGGAARQGNLQFAGASAGTGAGAGNGPTFTPALPVAAATAAPSTAAAPVEGFDQPGFERVAKMLFIRLQAANDARQIDDLRRFTTPELFASLRLDLQERGDTNQQTDVVQLEAQLLEHTQENGQWVASVRFHGLMREAADTPAEPFDEVWHFVQPLDRGSDWAIAGITTAA